MVVLSVLWMPLIQLALVSVIVNVNSPGFSCLHFIFYFYFYVF